MTQIEHPISIETAQKITITLLNSFFSSIKTSSTIREINRNNLKNVNKTLSSKKGKNTIQSFSNEIVLISIPQFHITSNRVVVQVFYYSPNKGFSNNALNALSNVISQLWNNTDINIKMTVELQIVRQYLPYINASILAQYLAINGSKYGFHRIINILLNALPYVNSSLTLVNNNTHLPSGITGVKVQLSGLLSTQHNRPRKTTYVASAGTFSQENILYSEKTGTLQTVIEYAQSTSKSRAGSFNVKVWLSSIV